MPMRTGHARKGSTLLELMATITVVGILFVSAALLLHRLLGVERTFSLDARTQMMISRMSEQWREDAHQADKIEWLPDPAKGDFIVFHGEHREIRWQKEKNRVIREVRRGTDRVTWNDFALVPGGEVVFEYDAGEKVARLRLNRLWPGSMANAEQTRYERERPAELKIEGLCGRIKR